ncbi:hypothetical protein ACGFK1_01825 [Mycobacterium sp. NPDC048908]
MCGFTRTLSSMVPTSVKGLGKAKPAPARGAAPAIAPGTRICEPAKARC